MKPLFWREATRRQRFAIAGAALSLVAAFGLLVDQDPEPRFVCANKLTGSRDALGKAPGVTDAISAAKTHCTGDVEAAAIELIRVYGLEPFGLGQKVILPED